LIKDISTDFDQLDIQFQESFKLLETPVSKQYNTALINSRLDPEKFAKLVSTKINDGSLDDYFNVMIGKQETLSGMQKQFIQNFTQPCFLLKT
jgi:hypothetical protein